MKPRHSFVAGNLSKHRARRRSDAVFAVIDQLERRLFLSGTGTLTTIAALTGAQGEVPVAVVQDAQGNLFGINEFTQANPDAAMTSGDIFEVPVNTSTVNVLYTFPERVDSLSPILQPVSPGSLIIDSSGNLYGTAASPDGTGGSVFELAAGATTPTTLAALPQDDSGRVTATDSAGDLFGIGGTADGTFEVAKNSGTITPLADVADQLQATIVDLQLGPDGNLYGVDYQAATTNASVFEISLPSDTLQVIASFDPTTSGDTPLGLTFDSSGNIWGFCSAGGPDGNGTYGSGSGTVWELPLPITNPGPSTTVNFIASFGGSTAGTGLVSGPAFDSAGYLYGLTEDGGANGEGTVFYLAPGSNTLTDLCDFISPDPGLPEGIVTNSSGIAPSPAATSTSAVQTSGIRITADGLSPATTTTSTAQGVETFGANSNTSNTTISGAYPHYNEPPPATVPTDPDDWEMERIRAIVNLNRGIQQVISSSPAEGIALAAWLGAAGGAFGEDTIKVASTQTGPDASLSSQSAPIKQMISQAKQELAAANTLINKYSAVYNPYTKEGTRITALTAQLAAQTNTARQAAIQKKITADDAVQAALLTKVTAGDTAVSNELEGIETLEANITTALAALPAPSAELSAVITSVPALINPGKRATAVVTVTNSGNVPVTLSFQMMLSARPQGTTGSADITLATDTIRLHRLGSGDSIPERLSFLIPKTLPAGTYSLVAVPIITSTLTGTATPVVSTVTFTVP